MEENFVWLVDYADLELGPSIILDRRFAWASRRFARSLTSIVIREFSRQLVRRFQPSPVFVGRH